MTTSPHKSQTTFSTIFQWRSIKTKVTLFTLTIFIIGIWSLAFYASYTLQNNMERSLGEQQFSTVFILASDINSALEYRLKSLEKSAALITPATLDNAASMQRFLEGRPPLLMMFNGGLWVARRDLVSIAAVPIDRERIGVNYSDRDWVVEVFKGKPIIGTPVMGKMLKAPVIPIVVPIRDTKGKVIGVLTGATDLGKPNFLSQIADYSYGKTGGYLLVAPKVRTIVHATDKKRIMEVLPGPGINPLVDRFLQGYEGSAVYVNPLGEEILASVKGIPVSSWLVGVNLPTKEAFAPIHASQQRMLLATIFLTLLVGGLTWWMLKRQLAPVFTTIKTLTTLSDTEQPPQLLPIARQDEIGELIDGFNRLLETLRQRDEALRESEEKYRTIIENMQEGYHEVDIKGNFTFFNESMRKIIGYEREELLGMNNRQYADEENIRKVYQTYNRVYRTGEPVKNFEWQIIRKDAARRDIEVSISLIRDMEAHPIGFRGIVRDITERKQAEEELKASQQQYRALAERIQQIREEERVLIARGIHDELGGGLSGLKMDLSWLSNRIHEAKTDEERTDLVNKIHISSELINHLIMTVRHVATDLRPSVLDDLGLIAALEWQLGEFTKRTEIHMSLLQPLIM